MVIDQLAADARFSGPQLIFSQISGKTTGGGSITGGGSVMFSDGNALLDLHSTPPRRCSLTVTMSLPA